MNNEFNHRWVSKLNAVVIPSWIKDSDFWFAPNFSDPFVIQEILERNIDLEKYADQKRRGNLYCKPCSRGGGVVLMDYPVSEWSVPALMMRKCSLRNPWGTARDRFSGISVVIPSVRATHRSGETAIPKAPSPIFGIEPFSDSRLHLAVTSLKPVARNWIELIKETLREFGWLVENENQPTTIDGRFDDWLQEKGLGVAWLSIDESSLPINELVAGIIYTGMSLAFEEMKSVFSIHLCGSIADLPDGFLPSANWNKLGKPVAKANQW